MTDAIGDNTPIPVRPTSRMALAEWISILFPHHKTPFEESSFVREMVGMTPRMFDLSLSILRRSMTGLDTTQATIDAVTVHLPHANFICRFI